MNAAVVPIDVDSIDRPAMLTAIAQANAARDLAPVWQLVQPLLDGVRLPREHVLAMVLFQLSMDAADAGDHLQEATLLQQMRESCSRAAIDNAIRNALLGIGARQGWLDVQPYQQLAEQINRLPENHPARLLFATIACGRRTEP